MDFLKQADIKTISTALVLLVLFILFFIVLKLISFLEGKYSKKESTKLLEEALKNMAAGQKDVNNTILTNIIFISDQIKETKEIISNAFRNNLLIVAFLLISVTFVSHISNKYIYAEGEKPIPVKTCNPPCSGNTYCDTSTGTCVARTSTPPLSGFDFVDLNKVGSEHYTSYLGFNR